MTAKEELARMNANSAELRKIQRAIDLFATQMKIRMENKFVEEGFTGWDNPAYLPSIRSRLQRKAAKILLNQDYPLDVIDIANFAMIIHFNENDS
ncbi:MAG: hypothetical protein DRI46_06760 [Chloroflexi bacterium]|nr:MAG: hypothetical protein DRI46_06760 [Chloroflexota bacterium]